MSERYDPSQQDLELAARLKEGRTDGLDDGDRALLAHTDALRESYEIQAAAPDTERMWKAITVATAAPSEERTSLKLVFRRPAWAAALAMAAVLVVAVSLSLFRSIPAEAQLLAEAGAESAVYTAPDGSVVTLRPHSQLFSESADAYRLEGEGLFDITHDPSRTVSVHAAGGRVDVLGTTFTVLSEQASMSVHLVEGSVRLSDEASGRELMLRPGEGARLTNAELEGPFTFSEAEELDWTQGRLVYASRRADSVAGELARHFDVRVELPDDAAADLISGGLVLRDLPSVLDDLALVLGGRFEETGPGTYRFER